MEILRSLQTRGHPVEYLQGRIMGRRGYLIADWDSLLAAADPFEAVPVSPYRRLTERSEEEVWRNLLRELDWMYRQMEPGLRGIFAPLFGWFELRTLVLCLRHKAARDSGKIGALLGSSLLAERLQKTLRSDDDLPAVVAGIAGVFAAAAVKFARLQKVWEEEGLTGFERELTDLYLEEVVTAPLHPLLAELFRRFIDMRNVMTLHKHLRWQIKAPPAFIRGGSIAATELRDAAEKREAAVVAQFVRRLAGTESPAAAAVEQPLLAGVARLLRKRVRESPEMALLLDYLWRSYLEARNLSLIIHGGALDRETLRGELIQ